MVLLSCDDCILLSGLKMGLAKVYSIETCGFVNLLNCRDDPVHAVKVAGDLVGTGGRQEVLRHRRLCWER